MLLFLPLPPPHHHKKMKTIIWQVIQNSKYFTNKCELVQDQHLQNDKILNFVIFKRSNIKSKIII
jgi:hypothetical protein